MTQRFSVYFFLLFLLGCQSGLNSETARLKANEGYSAEQTDKLFVVDCLLPGQIRRLGSQMTYLTARRPVKTTAGDCEIRGGEYVAYDRASYASALRVWLPQAKQGNVEAQVMLGEIYEKGLGGLADPALAAKWYRKAAEQGSSRAQINLGHLYEKGLGVPKSLPEALNWYRKASGLENTDLEFASVTEATLSAGYEKQLQSLRKSTAAFQKQATQLRHELQKARQSYDMQQKKLNTIRNQLQQSRYLLNQEKNKKDADRQLINKLEKDLQRNQISYDKQKEKLAEIQVLATEKGQNSVTGYREQLKNLQNQLKEKESSYHDTVIRIKSEMQQVRRKIKSARSTQDQLAVEQLRKKLKSDKANLLAMGRQIKQLKKNISDNQKIIASLDTEGNEKIVYAQAGIEMIEPAMVLTRGQPSFQLRSIRPNKKIIGKVSTKTGLKSLTVNGKILTVDSAGVFQTLININRDINPVEIVALYKDGKPRQLNFNLIAKGSAPEAMDQKPAVQAVNHQYPSIDFGRFYALVIGNQAYRQLPSLKTSVNDARAVEEILRNRYGYTTTLLINASRHQVMTALNEFRKILTEKDNLLIYYAGHGEIDKTDQSAYWLPTDAEPDNTANWLSSHSITQYLNIIAAKHILVVADSCYSGAMTQSAIVRLPEKMAEQKRVKWLKFMLKRKARTVMTSGGEEPVLDSGGGRHSVFAKAFLNVLQRNKGLMEDYELFRAVSGKVKREASMIGFQQAPQYSAMLYAGHEGSPFFFVPKNP